MAMLDSLGDSLFPETLCKQQGEHEQINVKSSGHTIAQGEGY